MRDNLKLGQSLSNNLDNTEKSIRAIALASENSAKNIEKITNHLTGNAEKFISHMNAAGDSTKKLKSQIDEVGNSTESLTGNLRETGNEVTGFQQKLRAAGSFFLSSIQSLGGMLKEFTGGLDNVARYADRFSEASNNMIRMSGMSGAVVREFRSEIMSTVSELNKATGGYYSPSEAYNSVISISQGITSNLEAMEEMAKPLLLTQESLDVNINTVASLMNRFYTKYNFSSANMEKVMNDIRGNTAGNSANAEATLENIVALENWIDVIAKDDNTKREEMMNEISHYTSWLESMEINSAPYTKYLEAIAYGDWGENKELLNILSRVNISATQAQDMARDGQWQELTVAITEGMRDMISDVQDSRSLGKALDNLGMDRGTALENWTTLDSANFTTMDEFLAKQATKEPETMAELVEDKYVSLADRTNHWLEQIYVKISDWQEKWGVGLSDILLATTLISHNTKLPDLLSRGLGNASALPTQGAPGVRGSGILGSLEMGGFNLSNAGVAGNAGAAYGAAGLAGVAAGAGMAWYGANEAINDFKSGDTGFGIANAAGATAGAVGAGALASGLIWGGAAAGPIGWVALAVAGITLLTTNIVKAATTIGEVEAIEKAYDEAAKSVKKEAKNQEHSLREILYNLDEFDELVKSGKATEEDLENIKRSIINTELLSESEVEKVRDANADSLRDLTKAYLKATDQWSDETEAMLNKYEKLDKKYAKDVKSNLVDLLQNWNDSGLLERDKEALGATEDLLYELYSGLEERTSSGEDLDKATQKIYESLSKAFDDGELSAKEANTIIDSGLWNTHFKNADFGVESLMTSLGIMSTHGNVGQSAYLSVTNGLGNYYGSENVQYVADIVGKVKSGNGVATAEEAAALLDELKSKGFTSAQYSEIGEAAEQWGLQGYSEGTNYVDRDQIALIHEGEAVVPKKYNPAVSNEDTKKLTEQLAEERRANAAENQRNRETMVSLVDEIREIKEFLSLWRDDNNMKDRLSDIRSKNSISREFISKYLPS